MASRFAGPIGFLRNAALYFLLAVPLWILLQSVLSLVFICKGDAASCGVSYVEGFALYAFLGLPMALGALLHYIVLVVYSRIKRIRPPRSLAYALIPLMPLTPTLVFGWSFALFTAWHSTLSLILAFALYVALMALPGAASAALAPSSGFGDSQQRSAPAPPTRPAPPTPPIPPAPPAP
jgi:hypothetical protein